jgi:hypothetical protein
MGPDEMYYRPEYLSTYPPLIPNSINGRAYPDGMCSTDNMNYVEFHQAPLERLGVPLDTCIDYDGTETSYLIYSTSSCASTGELTITLYYDSECTNAGISNTIWGNNCMSDDDDDGDDDDDDDDDDDYELTNVLFETFCS